jgi:hypothetical protein
MEMDLVSRGEAERSLTAFDTKFGFCGQIEIHLNNIKVFATCLRQLILSYRAQPVNAVW